MSSEKYIERSFCTTREAAEMLGISLRTAQLWSESGLLDAWKTTGGHRRISRQSIERLLSGRASDLPTRADPGADASADAFSVMVVEDDPDLRRLYEIKLRVWPMKPTVLTAGDGYEALVLLGLKRPDMLIADLQMPGLDGFSHAAHHPGRAGTRRHEDRGCQRPRPGRYRTARQRSCRHSHPAQTGPLRPADHPGRTDTCRESQSRIRKEGKLK
jgi:excisionase family DNA binding protein